MQDFKFTSNIYEDSGEPVMKMVFEGALTLSNASEIKKILKEQKQEFTQIALMVKNVVGLDVSFLQIIESWKKSLENNGGKVKIQMDLPYDLKTLLSNAGITYPHK
ncbi:MAG: STAS domain-containing protein [Bacteroidota bacterium]